MISSSDAYRAAIVADARRTHLRAVVDITDPDIVYGTINTSPAAAWAKPEELIDRETSIPVRYATLEPNRWLLGGFRFLDDNYSAAAETGYVSAALSGRDGVFSPPQFAEITFSNVDLLQACTLFFSDIGEDGFPVDFTVNIYAAGAVAYSRSFEGNEERNLTLTGFDVYSPGAIRVTVSRWSLPGRRMRVAEIVAGLYEVWSGNEISYFSLTQQGDISAVSLPYGTCRLRMDNADRRFEPRAKNSLFKSIEERQGVAVSIGVSAEGGIEYKPLGVYYQYSDGWRTSNNDITIQWSLVDIIGLLASREYIPPATLPTTLEGWIASLAAQLGANFANRYTVDPDYADVSVTALSRAEVTGKKCGDLLRFSCMAAGVWPRADAETGYLAAEPLWDQGNRLTIDNLSSYPIMKANKQIASVIFTIHDGAGTQYVVSGFSPSSPTTVSVDNPFIHTTEQAYNAARRMLEVYGGNELETTGRGDMSSEIGDVDTVELDEYSAMSARRIFQTFSFSDGVLKDCKSTLLQADGKLEYEDRVLLTGSGVWTVPEGVTSIKLVIGGGGDGGGNGTDGSFNSAGQNGANGSGGRIWHTVLVVSAGQEYAFSCGKGGGIGRAGTDTVFGSWSSAAGHSYQAYTDIDSADVYGRYGASNPRRNSGDGGRGGYGGNKGAYHEETHEWNSYNSDGEWTGGGTDTVRIVDVEPGKGGSGVPGADGFVLIYMDKERE
ncbi:MAG: hypothetical protein IJ705_02940 [Oscillospiraceae bacterium]|nr:hypothetical protein [Oscillospiraceae bacterium]